MWKHFKQYFAATNSSVRQSHRDVNLDSLYDPTVLVNMHTCSKRLNVFINLSNGKSVAPADSNSSSPVTINEVQQQGSGTVLASSPSSITSYMQNEYEYSSEGIRAYNAQNYALARLNLVKTKPHLKIVSNSAHSNYVPAIYANGTHPSANAGANEDIHSMYKITGSSYPTNNFDPTGTTSTISVANANSNVPLIYSPNFTRKMLSLQMT